MGWEIDIFVVVVVFPALTVGLPFLFVKAGDWWDDWRVRRERRRVDKAVRRANDRAYRDKQPAWPEDGEGH